MMMVLVIGMVGINGKESVTCQEVYNAAVEHIKQKVMSLLWGRWRRRLYCCSGVNSGVSPRRPIPVPNRLWVFDWAGVQGWSYAVECEES